MMRELDGLMTRRDAAADPDTRSRINESIATLRRSMVNQGMGDPFPSQGTVQPHAPGALREGFTDKMKEAQGTETGKEMVKEYTNLRNAGEAASRFQSTMTLLRDLVELPDVELASGPFAEKFNAVKSTLQSFGVKIGPSAGLEDVFKAFSTEAALKARTAGGENLLPGAMSNYEDQLLRSMMPQLTQSVEGRKALAEMMMKRTSLREAQRTRCFRRSGSRGLRALCAKSGRGCGWRKRHSSRSTELHDDH
jgi:hypothetical protein